MKGWGVQTKKTWELRREGAPSTSQSDLDLNLGVWPVQLDRASSSAGVTPALDITSVTLTLAGVSGAPVSAQGRLESQREMGPRNQVSPEAQPS